MRTILFCGMTLGALLLAPAVSAQRAAEDGYQGHGAALCTAAGELLEREGGADAQVREGLAAWRQILNVIDGTDERRRVAVDSARAGLEVLNERRPGSAAVMARSMWNTVCAVRDQQVRQLATRASDARIRAHVTTEPGGTPVTADVAARLHRSATCLAIVEMVTQRNPSRTLRAALGRATPRQPDAAGLRALRERSRQEVDAAPGSVAGKALLVDYFAYLFNTATSGDQAQLVVNAANQMLADGCPPPGARRDSGAGQPAEPAS